MSQPLNMLTNTPPRVDWDREVQELIQLLVGAVLPLPVGDKRRVLDKAIAPLFQSVVALNKLEKVPGEGLIVMSLLATGYQDYAKQLWPPKEVLGEEPASAAGSSLATTSKLDEVANVA
jgi:hypothetical protein